VVKQLKDGNNFMKVDDAALSMLESNYRTFIEASAIVKEQGLVVQCADGSIKEHPANKIARDAEAMALRIISEYGLTLKSRTKLTTTTDEQPSPLAQFLNSAQLGKVEKR
jgi:P27 family predicted phage terminase small subunit